MIKTISEIAPVIEIDLKGPEGSASVLLAYARKLGYTLGLTEDEVKDVLDEMQSQDHEHLVQVFADHFGNFVIMYR
jgi:hypothetical protein